MTTTRIPGTTEGSDLPRPAFGGRARLVNAVEVRLTSTFVTEPFDAGELVLRPGERVVVETDRGPMVGRVSSLAERRLLPVSQIRRVVRQATDDDDTRQHANAELADKVFRAGVALVRRHRVDMKLVQVQVPLDRSKVLVFFSSEQRVDFRGFVRDLASVVGARVEMRQMGVRDGAGVLGGIGPCGETLCCSTFLRRFGSISMRFAKAQGLSLNPSRITGMCGRLKCCLVYEQPVYKEMKAWAPRRKNGVITPVGPGNILDVDIINRRVLVRLQTGMQSFHVRDLILVGRPLTPEEMSEGVTREQEILARRRQARGMSRDPGQKSLSRQAASILQDEYMWDDAKADTAAIAERLDAPPKKKRRRRRNRSDASGAGGEQRQRSQPNSGDNSTGDGTPQKKRRRRRRKPSGSAEGANTRPAERQRASDGGASAGAAPAEGNAGAPKKKRRRRRRRSGGGSSDSGGSSGGSGPSGGGGGSPGGSGSSAGSGSGAGGS